ncbi:mannonate dehydratase [Hymenobacter psoromatis]|nr:mannonate dehydratase [Hymenobacter psoromatis]
MLHTMRWFGPNDPTSLFDLRQAGCAGVVTALHHLPVGAVWPVAEIQAHQQLIEAANATHAPLHWAVVESLPVHEDIKKGKPSRDEYIANYQQSLRHLAACGVRTVCYNFMPVLDWSRTDLGYEMPDGSRALRFVWQDFALFDLCILKRPGAEADYESAVVVAARAQFASLSEEQIKGLTNTILLGLPGAEESFQLAGFQAMLNEYAAVDAATLREHLHYFLRAVGPVAAEVGIGLCIHPDDPPFPLLGLPRVVSTEADLAGLLAAYDHPANGLTFCTGSLGVRPDNDLAGMARRFGPRIHFVHLRSTRREENPRNFHEADHLAGDVDMYAVVRALVQEEQRRAAAGEIQRPALPVRPDHGHQMLDDLSTAKRTYPGYSAIGRLRGLAELRGLELGIRRSLAEPTN